MRPWVEVWGEHEAHPGPSTRSPGLIGEDTFRTGRRNVDMMVTGTRRRQPDRARRLPGRPPLTVEQPYLCHIAHMMNERSILREASPV
jgi:hypothetical protein